MGARRGQGGDRAEEGGRFRIAPSRLRTFIYCPRLYFFETHMPAERGLLARLRMLAGTVYHAVAALLDSIRGGKAEEPVEEAVGGYLIAGRPDSWRMEDGEVVVVERKSGRGPRKGVWLSDLLQAVAYAIALARRNGARAARVRIVYLRGGSGEYSVGEDLVYTAMRAMEDMRLATEGVLPYPNRSPRKCGICPYREECYRLDEMLPEYARDSLFEPGSWVAGLESVYKGGRA
ncbi:CRISPR-associated protein Cas4 [Aeropyrum camini]|uniref:CRISPR-associated exonuclease Cas4 n=1 Tax=Aeropyrum camini SY1 = JCM 12091 TaxID=1198449 RepID=U3TCI3_9CREN|nr:CRISPR-associated protein Cas4 [Aeropyrum camini]BAN89745.1 RecB family exonuclease [Aeropyrum camini SY1 = JCM 12091]